MDDTYCANSIVKQSILKFQELYEKSLNHMLITGRKNYL